MRSSSLISAAAFFKLSTAAYTLEDDYTTDFYSKFNFFTGPDPTNGWLHLSGSLHDANMARLREVCRRSYREVDKPHQRDRQGSEFWCRCYKQDTRGSTQYPPREQEEV